MVHQHGEEHQIPDEHKVHKFVNPYYALSSHLVS